MVVETADGDIYFSEYQCLVLLGKDWATLEFNLVGVGDGMQAAFYDGTSTLKLHANLQKDASTRVKFSKNTTSGSTVETNNLGLGACTVNGSTIDITEPGGSPPQRPVFKPNCSQLPSLIAALEKQIENETSHPPACPSGIVALCSQQLRDDEAQLADLRAEYAKCPKP